jgi:hypothetical protein
VRPVRAASPDIYGFGSTVNYLTLQGAGTNQAAVEVAGTGTGSAQIAFGNVTVRRALSDERSERVRVDRWRRLA